MLNNKIYNFFLFNKSGICILEKQIETIINDIEEYNKYKILIKKIGHTFLNYYEKNKYAIAEIKENEDTFNLNKNKKYPNDNKFIFKFIQLEKFKILIMLRNNNLFIITYPIKSSTQFQRLLLIHIFIALINFKGDVISSLEKLNEFEKYKENIYINLKSFYEKNKSKLTNNDINNILELLIFENYFLKIIISHFSKVFNEMFKKEYLNLNQTLFKNLYILDLATSSIILDMCKIQEINKNIINDQDFIINNKLYEEILFLGKHLYNKYKSENDMKLVETDEVYRFVKFECSSTFPRLIFIIKFIPVLNGIAVIHLYYQKKLTRNNEENPLDQELKYKEIDLLFGSLIKGNQNLEFKYGAPKKLKNIEKFFVEFFITCRNGFDIFRVNTNKKFKYINYYIINLINSVPVSNNFDVDKMFLDINKKLEEEYNIELNKRNKEEIKEEINDNKYNEEKNEENEEENDDNEVEIEDEDESNIDNIFLLNKETIYNEILNIKKRDIKINLNNNKKQISSLFSEYSIKSLISEDKKVKENVNEKVSKYNSKEINSNLNSDNLICTGNSERKNLIKHYKGISSNNSRISIFSNISKVKTKERFKINILKIKNQNIKNKKNYMYNNNLSKENNYNLSELLDISDINQKTFVINDKNEKSPIQNTEDRNLISDIGANDKK